MDVAIIDYKMSNLFSVQAACQKVGLSSQITSDRHVIQDSKVVILPGVGAFGEAMKSLNNLKLDNAISDTVKAGKPLIGICLGLQLLFEKSEEFGDHKGLGLIDGTVKKFNHSIKDSMKFPVPQIGWNRITCDSKPWGSTVLNNNSNGDFMYFVHSYYVKPDDEKIILSKTIYGKTEYCSSIQKDNIFACQFHPEKSGELGLKIYRAIKRKYC